MCVTIRVFCSSRIFFNTADCFCTVTICLRLTFQSVCICLPCRKCETVVWLLWWPWWDTGSGWSISFDPNSLLHCLCTNFFAIIYVLVLYLNVYNHMYPSSGGFVWHNNKNCERMSQQHWSPHHCFRMCNRNYSLLKNISIQRNWYVVYSFSVALATRASGKQHSISQSRSLLTESLPSRALLWTAK